MSTGRVLWVIWCCWWFGAWTAGAVLEFGDPAVHASAAWEVLTVGMAVASLLAAFLPVGRAEPYEPLSPPPPSHPVHRNLRL